MEPLPQENNDLANLLAAPMPVPVPPTGKRSAFSDTEDEASGAMDHMDKKKAKELAKRRKEKESRRRKEEKEAKKRARAERKTLEKEQKRAAAAAAKRGPPPPPPAAARPVLAPISVARAPEHTPCVVEESVVEPLSPSTFERFEEETAPATDLAAAAWSKDEVDNFVTVLFQGEHFVKYGSYGSGKTKFCIANQEGSLFWSDRGGKTMNSIKLVNVTNVLRGKRTKVLKRKACRDVPETHCLSIVTDKRTVDLEATSEQIRDTWACALRYASGNVQAHGKVMLHPVTTNEMERRQRELGTRIAELEAERERQAELLRQKEAAIEAARVELAGEKERAEREQREHEEREASLLAEKARLAAEVQRIEHERKRSRTMKNSTLKQLQGEVEALQAVKREAEEKAAREKEQMTQLINESQKLLAKAKGTIHKRQASRAEHLTRIQQLEADLAEVETRNRALLEAATAAEREERTLEAHSRRTSRAEEIIAEVARQQGVDLAVECDEADEDAEAEAGAAEPEVLPPRAEAVVAAEPRRRHRSTISFAEVLTPAVWQPDGARVDCNRCPKSFTFFRRRHHCRKCGLLVCGSCSSKRAKIEETCDKVRVCDSCIAEHNFKPIA